MSLSSRLIGLKEDLKSSTSVLKDQMLALDEAIEMAKKIEERYPPYQKSRVTFIRNVHNDEIFPHYAIDNIYVLVERGVSGIMQISGADNEVVKISADGMPYYIYPADCYIIEDTY